MAGAAIRTLIVDDDFRVARVHAEVVAKVPGFAIVAQVHTASAALTAVTRHEPHLVLLDLYLPDANGLEVLRRLKRLAEPPDVIVLSAAREMGDVRAAMRLGALHYLIKPFDLAELSDRLTSYANLYAQRSGERQLQQHEIDRMFGLMRGAEKPVSLPKGHSSATATLVLRALDDADGALSAVEVADRVGISRATAQRYLSTLADAGRVELTLRYGATGRPEHRYRLGVPSPAEPGG